MSSSNTKWPEVPLSKIRPALIKVIQTSYKAQDVTISALARKSGTSRTRILDGNSEGISLDVLFRVLQSVDNRVGFCLVQNYSR